MGYETTYTLTYDILEYPQDSINSFIEECNVKGIEIPVEVKNCRFEVRLAEFLETDTNNEYYQPWSGFDSCTCKWYGHELDMLNLSKKFPTVLFKLEGDGEEKGDWWHKYFLNGKMQTIIGKTTFEEFDKQKLK